MFLSAMKRLNFLIIMICPMYDKLISNSSLSNNNPMVGMVIVNC